MDHNLRCNALKCRKELNSHAIVTTCSHIFCSECASRLQLSNPPPGQRPICPACEAILVNPDDAVLANLNPTDDYKTSVLSGLAPHLIMECASRALSFWAYQMSQEIIYEAYLAKSLGERYASLSADSEKLANDANAEIAKLHGVMSSMQVELAKSSKNTEELRQKLQDKTNKQMKTQEAYDKLKRTSMLGQVQIAASDAVDHTIEASVRKNRFMDHMGNINNSNGPILAAQALRDNSHAGITSQRSQMPPPPIPMRQTGMSGWNGWDSQDYSPQDTRSTPSSHRQRVASTPIAAMNFPSLNRTLPLSTPQLSHRPESSRPALSELSPNANANPRGYAGYGLSGGMKTSITQNFNPGSTFMKPQSRSRVAQRSGPPKQPNFGQPENPSVFGQRGGYY